MSAYLITGRSGAGKSAICQELQQRGLRAFDGDSVPGLAQWVDTDTGQPHRMDYSNPIVDRNRYHWNWDEATLAHLLKGHKSIFLCGSADNQMLFHRLFDKVFVLTLTPEEQRRRILARTSHDYGKHPEMQEQIIQEQRAFVKQAVELGAVAIDASPDISTVTDTILDRIHHER